MLNIIHGAALPILRCPLHASFLGRQIMLNIVSGAVIACITRVFRQIMMNIISGAALPILRCPLARVFHRTSIMRNNH